MSKPLRLAGVLVPLVVAALLAGWALSVFSRYPAMVNAASSQGATGTTAELTLQSVPATGSGPHPDWVTYLARQPDGTWVHSTMLTVPAHALVHVTILQYDSGSDLRNPVMLQPQGTVGPVLLNGKPMPVLTPKMGDVGHTFSIPQLGLSVPLEGVPDEAKNTCSSTPCHQGSDHNTVTFSFRTGAPGLFHWQCFVPCGTAFLYGNGGPMQTLGYMGGFLRVNA